MGTLLATAIPLLLLLLLPAVPQLAEGARPAACNCNLRDNLHFFKMEAQAQEHSVPDTFNVGVSHDCLNCVVFDRLANTSDWVEQGNWTIERDGTIRFNHRPHKTGVAKLSITVEETSSSSDYVAHTFYTIKIAEEPDFPLVFASRFGLALELTDFDSVRYQYRNLTLSVEQNTGNNTAYSDLLFTAGVFDYDSNEAIRVEVPDDETPRLGRLINPLNSSISTALLDEPSDCNLTDSERLALRNLTEWDTRLTDWHPCNLSLPYPPAELSWLSHLAWYRPGLLQTGVDRFVLAYTDKYRLQARLHIRVHILQNPCVNEGRCWGPSWDPDCVSLVRSDGFFNQGYLCHCPTGWVGDRCEIDFDDCSSSPCPSPFVCVDKFRGYDCVCPENLINCQPLLPAWQLAAILLGLAACVCAIAAILILASQRAPAVLPVAKSRRPVHLVRRSPASQAFAQSPSAADAADADDAEKGDANSNDEAAREDNAEEPSSTTPLPLAEEAQPAMAGRPLTPLPPTPAPPTPELTLGMGMPRRPPNPGPDEDENRRLSYKRASIFVPRRRQDDWRPNRRRSTLPFNEEAGGDVNDDDALRLRQLREQLQNQQVLQEF